MVLFGQRTSLLPRLMNRLLYGNYLNKSKYTYENGLPHTRDNIIFIPIEVL
jgi:hypothetical protein